MGFDVGTCRESFDHDRTITYAHSSAVTVRTPIYVTGLGVLIPMNTALANVKVTYRRRGIVNFIVANSITTTVGCKVYYDSTNGVITTSVPTAGNLLGTAMDAVTGNSAGTVTCNVNINVFGEEGNVNIFGSTGLFKASYASIDLAVAAITSGDIVKIKSGEYTLAAGCDIPYTCKIIGDGDVVINGGSGADYCFKSVLGAITSTAEITFKNLHIEHSDDATQVGIQLDNTSATSKINCYLHDVSFGSDGGNSIDVDEPVATDAIRVYMYAKGHEVEGPVNISVKNDGTRFRAFGASLIGGLVTSADAVAAEITLKHCGILHEGVTGGNAAQTVNVIACYSDNDGGTYAAVDTADLAGSHTENIIAFD